MQRQPANYRDGFPLTNLFCCSNIEQNCSPEEHVNLMSQSSTQASGTDNANISLLSTLVIQGYNGDYAEPQTDLEHLTPQLDKVAGLNEEQFRELVELADTHHVTVRALRVLEWLAIPYTGARSETLALCRRKERVNAALTAAGACIRP